MHRLPTFFLSHGGGPWPYVEELRSQYSKTERELRELPRKLPDKPRAILLISGHWETAEFTVSTSEHPPMEYDYSGFPAHTYQIQYGAPGSPGLANQVGALLGAAGFEHRGDAQRGFDHGAFVPLELMYPEADMPVVLLSIRKTYDAAQHLRAGQALAPLRDEGVLIIGSGLTYHNMRGFGRRESTLAATHFEAFLSQAVSSPSGRRNEMLINWAQAPDARAAHPREDHLIPLMVVAGAAGEDTGGRLFVDQVMAIPMTSYQFGLEQPSP